MVTALPSGAAMVSGTVAGQPVMLTAAFSTVTTMMGQQGVLILSNRSDTCSQIAAGHVEKDLQLLLFTPAVDFPIGFSAAPTPGTYPVIATSKDAGAAGSMAAGEVGFIGTDANCKETENDLAVGGSLTLSSVAHDAFVGNVDVKLLSGAHLTGRFNASACAGLGNFQGAMSGCF
jgi:hypothetical protein